MLDSQAERGFKIGRMYYAHPSSGERFYLCLLLTTVAGTTPFEDLRTFQGILYSTFREACIAYGLLEDDNEWHQCFEEAKHMAVSCQIHYLFITILKDCNPTNLRELWDTLGSTSVMISSTILYFMAGTLSHQRRRYCI